MCRAIQTSRLLCLLHHHNRNHSHSHNHCLLPLPRSLGALWASRLFFRGRVAGDKGRSLSQLHQSLEPSVRVLLVLRTRAGQRNSRNALRSVPGKRDLAVSLSQQSSRLEACDQKRTWASGKAANHPQRRLRLQVQVFNRGEDNKFNDYQHYPYTPIRCSRQPHEKKDHCDLNIRRGPGPTFQRREYSSNSRKSNQSCLAKSCIPVAKEGGRIPFDSEPAATVTRATLYQSQRRNYHYRLLTSFFLTKGFNDRSKPRGSRVADHRLTLLLLLSNSPLLASKHYDILFIRKNLAKLDSTNFPSRNHSSGHSHSHSHGLGGHHHHDNIYLTSKDKSDSGVRITRIGLYVNVLMAISKGIGGWYFNSQALVADAFHAMTDLVSDILTLSTVSLALKSPTERFPNGYGKIESLGSLGVSGLLLFAGLAMGYNSLEHIYIELFTSNPAEYFIQHSHGHSHSHTHLGPNINAAWLAFGSIIVKEWLYRATMKIARQRKSTVLASNAIHHRIDSLTSVVALIAIAGSHIFENAPYLDPIGGLIVSVMVVQAGWANTRAAVLELADVGLDGEMKANVQRALSLSGTKTSDISSAHEGDDDALGNFRDHTEASLPCSLSKVKVINVGGIKSGQNYLVELTLATSGDMTVSETRNIEERVRKVLAGVRGVRKVKVRFVNEDVKPLTEFVGFGTETERVQQIGYCEVEDHAHGHEHGDSKRS